MQQNKRVTAKSIVPDRTHLEVNFYVDGELVEWKRWRGVWIPFESFLPGVPLEIACRVKLDEVGQTLIWPDDMLPPLTLRQAIVAGFQLPWPGGNTRGKNRPPRQPLKISRLRQVEYGNDILIDFENDAVISFGVRSVPGADRILKKDRVRAYVDKQTGAHLKWQGVPGLRVKITTLIKDLLGFPKIGATGGRVGGRAKTERKVLAAQRNGAKGGRPKKQAPKRKGTI